MDSFSGKVAAITGGGGGIGLATGRLLARQGMKVVLADVNAERLDGAVAACQADGLDIVGVPTDVSSFESMRALADAVYERYGALHVLHLNAGISSGASLFDDVTANWDVAVGVNLMGVLWGIKAFVPRMVAGGEEGAVLATSSGAGAEGTSYGASAYAITKMGVLTAMECLYGQLRDQGSKLHVGVVFPPLTATNLVGNPEAMKMVESMLQSNGVPSTLCQPEQVAAMVLDGLQRRRFFIRTTRTENEPIYGGAHDEAFFEWNDRIVRGRAEQQMADGLPDSYLW